MITRGDINMVTPKRVSKMSKIAKKSLSPVGPDGVFLLIFDAGVGVDLTPGVKSRQNCPNLIPGLQILNTHFVIFDSLEYTF